MMLSYKQWLISGIALLLAACSGQRVMMPTPNVYADSDTAIYADLHQDFKSTEVPLFYVTDRQPEKDDNGNLKYGYGRSNSLAFGTAVVDLGENISWEQLLEASRTQKRLDPVNLEVTKVTEIQRGPPAPIPYTEIDGVIVEDPEYVNKRLAAAEVFRHALVKQLNLTPRKEVFIKDSEPV